jgi:hypothetical protein
MPKMNDILDSLVCGVLLIIVVFFVGYVTYYFGCFVYGTCCAVHETIFVPIGRFFRWIFPKKFFCHKCGVELSPYGLNKVKNPICYQCSQGDRLKRERERERIEKEKQARFEQEQKNKGYIKFTPKSRHYGITWAKNLEQLLGWMKKDNEWYIAERFPQCKCQKCNHQWQSKKKKIMPPKCPQCNQKEWWIFPEVTELENQLRQKKGQRRENNEQKRKEEKRKTHNNPDHTPMTQKEAREWLNVKENATKEEIKKAYKEIMKDYHPDKLNKTPPKMKQEIEKTIIKTNEAKETLLK